MLILLPTNVGRRILYGISTDYLTAGILVTKKWKTRIRNKVPSGITPSVPIIYKYKVVGPHRFGLVYSNTRTGYATAGTVRKTLLTAFGDFIIEEHRWWRPSNAWKRIRWSCSWCRRYWVVTSRVLYPGGTEPDNLYVNRVLIAGPVVVMIT